MCAVHDGRCSPWVMVVSGNQIHDSTQRPPHAASCVKAALLVTISTLYREKKFAKIQKSFEDIAEHFIYHSKIIFLA